MYLTWKGAPNNLVSLKTMQLVVREQVSTTLLNTNTGTQSHAEPRVWRNKHQNADLVLFFIVVGGGEQVTFIFLFLFFRTVCLVFFCLFVFYKHELLYYNQLNQ